MKTLFTFIVTVSVAIGFNVAIVNAEDQSGANQQVENDPDVSGIIETCTSGSCNSLTLEGKGVRTLASLSDMTWVEELWLEDVSATDLAALSTMTGLRELFIYRSKIAALPDMSQLSSIRRVVIDGSEISDVSTLGDLPYLTILAIKNSPVENIEPIGRSKRLRQFVLDGTQVRNLNPLQDLKQLEILHIKNSPVTSLAGLEGLEKLETLVLSHVPVSDLSPLFGLNRLEVMRLRHTKVTDLRPVLALEETGVDVLTTPKIIGRAVGESDNSVEVKALLTKCIEERCRILTLEGDGVRDLTPLQDMVWVNMLVFAEVATTNFSHVRRMKRLQAIVLLDVELDSYAPMAGLMYLNHIRLSRTPFETKDGSKLTDLSKLKAITVFETGINDWSSFSQLSQLETLSVYSAKPDDMEALQHLANDGVDVLAARGADTELIKIEPQQAKSDSEIPGNDQRINLQLFRCILTKCDELILKGKGVRNLTEIYLASKLKILFLSDSEVHSLAPLAKSKSLSTLALSDTKIKNLDELSLLDNIKVLALISQQISDYSPLLKMKSLEIVDLRYIDVKDQRTVKKLREKGVKVLTK